MGEGRLPNFKRLHDRSEVFVTVADETEPHNLEPWIQWYSLHTGLPYQQHKVFHLTDGPRAAHPDIWSILMDEGKRVWNCGSMNARGFSRPGSAFMPDPWCTGEAPYPPELAEFHGFVARAVQEYSNADRPLSRSDYARFLKFLVAHGLQPGTIISILSQLAGEIRSGGKTSWRRATILDRLQFDVFRHYYRKLKPDLATFFVNSTAHLQHSYWRCMEPGSFTVQPSADELDRYGDAILYGYQQMDRLLPGFFELAEHGATLAFATALSQQPYLKYEHVGGHRFYRPRQAESLLAAVGVHPVKLFPVMTHQYLAHFASENDRKEAERTLLSLTIDGEQVFLVDPSDDVASLYFGCRLRSKVPDGAAIRVGAEQGRSLDFHANFYLIEGMKSGRHHPDGCFWIANGRHIRHADKVSIIDILPTLLGMFGVARPGLPGHNLQGSDRAQMAA